MGNTPLNTADEWVESVLVEAMKLKSLSHSESGNYAERLQDIFGRIVDVLWPHRIGNGGVKSSLSADVEEVSRLMFLAREVCPGIAAR